MGEIVNLRMARKAKARVEREREAGVNHVLHGRSKAQRTLHAARISLDASRLEGHRRETPPAATARHDCS